jgi:hypothetical protein
MPPINEPVFALIAAGQVSSANVNCMITESHLPGPKSRFALLTFIAFRHKPIEFLMRAAREYGDVVYFRFGPQAVFFLNHPDLIRDVLVTLSPGWKVFYCWQHWLGAGSCDWYPVTPWPCSRW